MDAPFPHDRNGARDYRKRRYRRTPLARRTPLFQIPPCPEDPLPGKRRQHIALDRSVLFADPIRDSGNRTIHTIGRTGLIPQANQPAEQADGPVPARRRHLQPYGCTHYRNFFFLSRVAGLAAHPDRRTPGRKGASNTEPHPQQLRSTQQRAGRRYPERHLPERPAPHPAARPLAGKLSRERVHLARYDTAFRRTSEYGNLSLQPSGLLHPGS